MITDFCMPHMGGLELLKLQEARGCNTRIENKTILIAAVPTIDQEEVEEIGCHVIRKLSRAGDVKEWLVECTERFHASRESLPA